MTPILLFTLNVNKFVQRSRVQPQIRDITGQGQEPVIVIIVGAIVDAFVTFNFAAA